MFPVAAAACPIGIADGHPGAGLRLLSGFAPALNLLANVPLSVLTDYNPSVIPMFILMGAFCSTAGMSRELFDAGRAWVGHRRGGLALASIAACAGFAAINGSSVITAATMTQVALPRCAGRATTPGFGRVIAAGGTLGIMIPPLGDLRALRHHDRDRHHLRRRRGAGPAGGAVLRLVVAFIAHRHPEADFLAGRRQWLGRTPCHAEEPVADAGACSCWAGQHVPWVTVTEAAGIGASGALVDRPRTRPAGRGSAIKAR